MAQARLTIIEHHSVEELKRRYLRCKHPVEKRHWQAIWLLARQDKQSGAGDVAQVLGCGADWVRKLARRYNRHGEAGLADGRRNNRRPPDGGLWSGPKVGELVGRQAGRPVSDVTGWKYLRKLGFRLLVPRPRHRKAASPGEQEDFKKNCAKKSLRCGRQTPAKPLRCGRKTRRGSASSP